MMKNMKNRDRPRFRRPLAGGFGRLPVKGGCEPQANGGFVFKRGLSLFFEEAA